jgi:aryl-alcohol dehydrogenase-like predicted oxidoreductase
MEQQIPQRYLGKSNLQVTAIGLGCWQFSKQKNLAGKFWPSIQNDTITRIIQASLEGGINWFDTAEVYGNGASERALASALASLQIKPGKFMVATKWWPMFRTASNIPKTISQRISALQPYPIDLYQVHQPWGFSTVKAEMDAMAKLVKEGTIKHVGVSNFSAQQMRSAWESLQKHGINLVSNQVRYNLLDRKIESNGILQTAKELGISIIAYSPLAQGLVTGKFHDNPQLIKTIGMRKFTPQFKQARLETSRPVVKCVQELAGKYGVTPSQIALNWLVQSHGETVVAIPGATTEKHAKENASALNFVLTAADLSLLDAKSVHYK